MHASGPVTRNGTNAGAKPSARLHRVDKSVTSPELCSLVRTASPYAPFRTAPSTSASCAAFPPAFQNASWIARTSGRASSSLTHRAMAAARAASMAGVPSPPQGISATFWPPSTSAAAPITPGAGATKGAGDRTPTA